MEFTIQPLGDSALIVELGTEIDLTTHQKVQMIADYLDDHPPEWMLEYIPAFTTVAIFYDPVKISQLAEASFLPYSFVSSKVKDLLASLTEKKVKTPRLMDIPVCYGGDFGSDLSFVAKHNGLTEEEVIEIHSNGEYVVYMIGFAPGFAYIGGMSEKIAAPRRESPRLKIPARTVGIAGMQTGIYPIETPGGWRLIGRTPIELFRPNDDSPSLLRAGDKIKFTPISHQEYREWEETGR